MSEQNSGKYTDYGSFGLIDEEYLVPEGYADGIESGSIVNYETIEGFKGVFKIIGLIGDTKEVVSNIIEGYFKETGKGFGFIRIPGQKDEIFVPKSSISGAKAGDKVKAVLGMSGGREEALITEILDKANPIFIGEVIIISDKLFVELENGEVVNIKNSEGIKKGDILSIHLEKDNLDKDVAILKEILGDKNDLGIQTIIIAARNGARIHFPQSVLDEANSLDGNISENEILEKVKLKKLVDLRDIFTVTMDGATAKDKDDAVSVKLLPNGDYILYTSIADVTHYVKENHEIDNEALLRGTSLYYGDRVTPMIPEILSNDICSLNPDTDKYTVTCEIYVNANGTPDIEKSKVYNSVIKSNHAITYEETDNVFKGEMKLGDKLMFGGEVTEELVDLITDGFNLSELIGREFKKQGKLGINSTETKIIVDKMKKPIGIEAYPKHDSNELIENFMVIANNVVPQVIEKKLSEISEFSNKGLPFVHRTHGEPNEAAVEKLKNTLEILEVDFDFGDDSSKTFSTLLDFIKGHPKEKFLTKKITTTLQKAIYTAIREGHFGLALEYYSHFTSPIRRYPDLQIHRIIKEILAGTLTIEKYEHYMDILPGVTEQSSKQEEMSERNEADVNKYLGVELLKDKIGMKFGAYIDDIDGKKIKIILDNTISGIIDLSNNKGYDSEKLYEGIFKLKNTKTKEEIGLGDEISVILESADIENMQLYFKLEK